MDDKVIASGPQAIMYNNAAMYIGGLQLVQEQLPGSPNAARTQMVLALADALHDDKTVHKGAGSVNDYTVESRVQELATLRNHALELASQHKDREAREVTAQWKEKQQGFGMWAFTQVAERPELLKMIGEKSPEVKKAIDILYDENLPHSKKVGAVVIERELREQLADTLTASYVLDPQKRPSELAPEAKKIMDQIMSGAPSVGGKAPEKPKGQGEQLER